MYLVFDTETNGLIPKPTRGSSQPLELDKCPHILQISAALYSMAQQSVIDTFDYYIDIDDSVEIPSKTTEIHGIDKALCKSRGIPIMDAIKKFHDFYTKCEAYIGHNIEFDMNMIKIEIERNRADILERAPECLYLFNEMHEKVNNIEKYCTMDKSRKLCNIIMTNEKTGKPYVKSPKLIELHKYLFPNDKEPENLHNSMNDVNVTLRCYLKMRHNLDFSDNFK